MAGTVGSTIVIKGIKVRLRESYGDDPASFESALEKVTEQAITMRKAAETEAASKRGAYRKPKGSKNG